MVAKKKYRSSPKTKRARSLRNDATGAEKLLWSELNRKQINGLKFRRQHPASPYVLDFYCIEIKLCIELDGSQHGEDEQIRRDKVRTGFLEARGIHVLRFWNNEVYENTEGVVEMIWDVAETLKRKNLAGDECEVNE